MVVNGWGDDGMKKFMGGKSLSEEWARGRKRLVKAEAIGRVLMGGGVEVSDSGRLIRRSMDAFQ